MEEDVKALQEADRTVQVGIVYGFIESQSVD